MDQELIAYLDARFRESSRQIEGLREENNQKFAAIDQRFDAIDRRFEHVDDEIRLTRVVVEGLRHEVHIVAEGVIGVSERLAANQSETLLKLDEVRASMVPYYQDLNRRMIVLEGRADRQNRDIMEVIKERFGKPQT